MNRLAICAVFSLLVHVAFERGLELLPEQEPKATEPRIIEVRVIEPPPQPIVEPPPPPPPVVPPPPVPASAPAKAAAPAKAEPAAPRPTQVPHIAAPAQRAGDAGIGGAAGTTTAKRRSSTAAIWTAISRPGGNGTGAEAAAVTARAAARWWPRGGSAIKQHEWDIGAFEATKLPLPQGLLRQVHARSDRRRRRRHGHPQSDRRRGRPRARTWLIATDKLPNQVAKSADRRAPRLPVHAGREDGHPVPVRIRGFGIRFVLEFPGP